MSTVFGVRSNADHAAQMKPIQRHYTLGNVLTCEPLVDRTTKSFLETLDKRFAADAKPFHLDEYLLYCEYPCRDLDDRSALYFNEVLTVS